MDARIKRLRWLWISGDAKRYVARFVKRFWGPIMICVVLLGFFSWFAYLRWVKGWVWAEWTGWVPYLDAEGNLQRGKTLWDWMELLIIPVVLAFGALLFNKQERQNELKIADGRNQDAVLQDYYDKMSELILEKGLMDVKRLRNQTIKKAPDISEDQLENLLSDKHRAVRDMAQIRTITALRQLNSARQELLFQFIRDASLSDFLLVDASLFDMDLKEIWMGDINLSRANLENAKFHGAACSGVNLSGAVLYGADLSGTSMGLANLNGAILTRANLHWAFMEKANLDDANLRMANLSGACLSEASLCKTVLRGADLTGAECEKADFTDADLTGAILVKADLNYAKVNMEQLASVQNLQGATMPDGEKYNPVIHNFIKSKTADIKSK